MNDKKTNIYKEEEEDDNQDRGRNKDNYKEKEKRERIRRRRRRRRRNRSRRRYDIEGCRAYGRISGAETLASLLGFRSASFDVR
eukprot:4990653-Heterocapsa_arctica.AAC.1